jgi:hypothetical protein
LDIHIPRHIIMEWLWFMNYARAASRAWLALQLHF